MCLYDLTLKNAHTIALGQGYPMMSFDDVSKKPFSIFGDYAYLDISRMVTSVEKAVSTLL